MLQSPAMERTSDQLPRRSSPDDRSRPVRGSFAETADSVLTMLHWHVGMRIRREALREARAVYGEEILRTRSAELLPRYGRGFRARNLARMISFADVFPDERIVATLWQQ